jgi:SAM-dependent methyltransferase
MERQYFATGFRNVDTSGDPRAFRQCLDRIAGIPFFAGVKQKSIGILAAGAPALVLDAGCGAGTDLVALASSLPGESRIIGLDASAALLACAAERTGIIRKRCTLVQGDILSLPFRDGSFDACRIDRVLQHIHDPERGIRELARTLRPGGTLVAFDNDWGTLSICLDDPAIASCMARTWERSFASGRIGRDLRRIFPACGLADIRAEPLDLVMTDPAVAEWLFDIPHLLMQMEQAGSLAAGETAAIRSEIRRRETDGTFFSRYTAYLICGKRP